MSDSELKVNRNIYPVVVTCDRMHLIGPMSGQVGPINHCLLEELCTNVVKFCENINCLGNQGKHRTNNEE